MKLQFIFDLQNKWQFCSLGKKWIKIQIGFMFNFKQNSICAVIIFVYIQFRHEYM